MCPAYAKKAGNERKKWAKPVPTSVDAVQTRTGMGFVGCVQVSTPGTACTSKCTKSTIKVHPYPRDAGMIQIRA
jgi:hypothetical protein